MTYLESYQKCKTKEELAEKVKGDAVIAMLINPARIKPIEDALNKVADERGWEMDESVTGLKS